jgi:hypothetical protein
MEAPWIQRRNNYRTRFTGEEGGDTTTGEESTVVAKTTRANGCEDDQSEGRASPSLKVKLRVESVSRV